MEILIIIVLIAVCAYEFGTGKEERERGKRKVAEYRREWEEWRVKNNAVQDEHGNWRPTPIHDQDNAEPVVAHRGQIDAGKKSPIVDVGEDWKLVRCPLCGTERRVSASAQGINCGGCKNVITI